MKRINKEIKLDVSKVDIIKKLRDNNAVLIGGSKEITTRYDTLDNSLEKEGKFIRIREGFNNIISLKERVNDNLNIFERDEFEVEIDDIENIQYILTKIGLNPILKMEKYRLKWDLDGIKLNLDELPFGLYLEIHGNKDSIDSVMNKLNISESSKIVATYWDIYDKYKEENNIKEKDIAFSKDYNYRLM